MFRLPFPHGGRVVCRHLASPFVFLNRIFHALRGKCSQTDYQTVVLFIARLLLLV